MSTLTPTNSCLVSRAWTRGVPPALAEKVTKAEQAAVAAQDKATLSQLGRMEVFAETNCTDRLSDIALNAGVGLAIGLGAHFAIGGALGTLVGSIGMGLAMPTLNKHIQETRLSSFADKILAAPAPAPQPQPTPAK